MEFWLLVGQSESVPAGAYAISRGVNCCCVGRFVANGVLVDLQKALSIRRRVPSSDGCRVSVLPHSKAMPSECVCKRNQSPVRLSRVIRKWHLDNERLARCL